MHVLSFLVRKCDEIENKETVCSKSRPTEEAQNYRCRSYDTNNTVFLLTFLIDLEYLAIRKENRQNRDL